MRVDSYSSLSHYSEHLRPIWDALPPSVRGGWWTPANLPRSERLTIVASHRDALTIGRPYVYVEHGAGQSYQGITSGSYSGGEGHDRCVLFLCPSERVAMRWRERYDVPAVAVGCPRLDRYSERAGPQGEAARGVRSGALLLPGARGVGTSAGPTTPASPALVERATPNETPSAKKSEKSRGETGSAWHKTGDSPLQLDYDESCRVEQWPACRAHNPEVVGSTPTPATRGNSPEDRCRTGDRTLTPKGRGPVRLPDPAEVASPHLGTPAIAISFHWDCALIPETRSAWRYYDPHLPRLVRDPRFRVVGHGHPRLWPTIRRRWAELGVDQWPDVDRVLSEADVVVADNTSLLYEACALGIPTVCLNIPSYRRDVEHGGRFWDAPPGIQVDHPSELADAIACALTDPPAHRAIRARAVAWAYSAVDGHASERAATAIMEVLSR